MSVSAEEFARWRVDRVTQWVFKAFATVAEENKSEWVRASWEQGVANPLLLAELRTRSDSYRAIIDASYEAHCETNGDEADYDAR